MGTDSKAVIRRVVGQLRDLVDASVQLSGSIGDLEVLEEDLDRALEHAKALAVGKPMDKFGPFEIDQPNAVLPYSPITGYYHPMAPPVELEFVDSKLIGRASFGEAYEGPNQCLHGSIIAGVYDQLLAIANIAGATGGPTASLTIHYRKPTPLHQELTFEAWTERVEGRKIYTKGRCSHNGVLLSEAEGLFIHISEAMKYKPWLKND